MANKVYQGTGHRKSSIAKVTLVSGKGNITVNGRDVNEYFPFPTLVMDLKQPLTFTNTEEKFDITVEVKGGGFSGQAGAVRLGITKALLEYDKNTDPTSDSSFRKILKAKGMITRDSRIKERKKPGLKKARKAPQFSKR
ncbi:MAG: 30S ribosomal protein S9 [Bacilli bacterium]|nr:30S ribosomal protein S9 [Bacilli bacterium]